MRRRAFILPTLAFVSVCASAADDTAMETPRLTPERMHALLDAKPVTPGSYFKRQAEGWWWYEDPALIEDVETGDPAAIVLRLDAAQTVEESREIFQASLNSALMRPSHFTVTRYMYAKDWIMERAELFSNYVQRVRFQTPALDYSLISPANNTGALLHRAERDEEDAENLRALAANGAGIFFFFSSTCPYCQAMAPMLSTLQAEFGIEILSVTVDGGALPEFPEPRPDNGAAERLGVATVPALFLAHPQTNEILPLGAGMVSRQELIQRIYALTRLQAGESR
jgi:conjugal transfer pilus assembly protein TraF